MSTVLQLVNRVLERTGQTRVDSLTNAVTPARQALECLNDAYSELLQSLDIGSLLRQATLSTVAGQSQYSLASDASPTSLVSGSLTHYGERVALNRVSPTYVSKLDTSQQGKPAFYWFEDGLLTLWPTPNTSYTLNYAYAAVPEPLTQDSQTPAVPAEWERVLIQGAQAYLERFLGDENANGTFNLYQNGLSLLKRKGARQPQPRMRGAFRGYSA